jgi:hypothetical protein
MNLESLIETREELDRDILSMRKTIRPVQFLHMDVPIE